MKGKFCKCMGPRAPRDAVRDLLDESKEVLEVKSIAELKDELSDVSWGIGRLVAGLFGKVYVRVPGDRAHYMKVQERMTVQGCVRSARQISMGKGCK